jgi:apolipoprotein N-acyltransferase
MTTASTGFSFSNASRWIGVAICVLIAAFSGYKMLNLPLWGWWPLPLELASWMALVLLFLPKDPTEKKWLGAATLSGVLLGIGFPPSIFTFVIFVAWIPLLAVENGIYQQRDKVNRSKMFRYAYHAFVLWNVIATFWVTNTAFIAGIMANFVNAAFMALIFVFFHSIRHRLSSGWFFWLLASCWIGFEYLHHEWDLSWPWLALGNSMAQYPWAVQWYEYTGIYGGSLWVLAINYLGYDTITRWLRAQPLKLWRLIVTIVVPLSLSLVLWFTTKESTAQPVNVTVVQPNFEPHYVKFDVSQRDQNMRFLELSLANIDSTTDYLVFPETSFEGINLGRFRDEPSIKLFQELIDSFPRLHLVTGISSYRELAPNEREGAAWRTQVSRGGDTTYWDVQNTAIQLNSREEEYQYYFKSKLVPGPETFPFKEVLFFLQPVVEYLEGSYEGHTRQKERAVFTKGPLIVAPVICYESIYGAYCGEYVDKGATAFFIVTNDGWWDLTPGHIQHLKLGALRAIEHRRPIARSANTGISCFIDIKGRIHQPTEYEVATAVRGQVIPETRRTLFSRVGDVIPKVLLVLLAGCIIMAILHKPNRN